MVAIYIDQIAKKRYEVTKFEVTKLIVIKVLLVAILVTFFQKCNM